MTLNEPGNIQLIALVDELDNITGYAEKMEVHKKGLLHRAFSIFVFNDKKELLLQQRALHKYHSPGLWTNTCCSHLLQGMDMEECVHDRLSFEMGFDCDVTFAFPFTYKAHFDNGLTEHETDHVYFAQWDGIPQPNPDEVASYKWVGLSELEEEIKTYPERYTYWFLHIIDRIKEQMS